MRAVSSKCGHGQTRRRGRGVHLVPFSASLHSEKVFAEAGRHGNEAGVIQCQRMRLFRSTFARFPYRDRSQFKLEIFISVTPVTSKSRVCGSNSTLSWNSTFAGA